jgi:hypothetical protein
MRFRLQSATLPTTDLSFGTAPPEATTAEHVFCQLPQLEGSSSPTHGDQVVGHGGLRLRRLGSARRRQLRNRRFLVREPYPRPQLRQAGCEGRRAKSRSLRPERGSPVRRLGSARRRRLRNRRSLSANPILVLSFGKPAMQVAVQGLGRFGRSGVLRFDDLGRLDGASFGIDVSLSANPILVLSFGKPAARSKVRPSLVQTEPRAGGRTKVARACKEHKRGMQTLIARR